MPMSTEIYYFSGTGNSLHVARELQKRIPEARLTPMVHLLNQEIIKTQAEIVGFVFPVYLSAVPAPVRKFLEKLDVRSSRYIFAAIPHGGYPGPGFATIRIGKILKKQGKRLDSSVYLHMANNSPTGLMPPSMPGLAERAKHWVQEIGAEKVAELESEVQKQLEVLADAITRREKHPQKAHANPIYYVLEYFMAAITKNTRSEIKFYTDPQCSGCGICERVCLSGKIQIIYDNPVWKKDIQCFYCYACFNCCPSQSIFVKDAYMEQKDRYIHPAITAGDISGQK
jgi:ferredoxin/flavodoxin